MRGLKELLAIDKNFQNAVNLRLDRENADKMESYIPTSSSVLLLKQFFKNIIEQKGNSASILIGPYGKGKSHLLLVLLALLEQNFLESSKKVLRKVAQIDEECAKIIKQVTQKGRFLAILVSDTGSGMNTSFLLALQEALKRNDLLALIPDSYFGEAVKCIECWKVSFPETYLQLQNILQNSKEYGAESEPTETFIAALEAYNEFALQIFREIYPQLTAGAQFAPLINTEAVVLYQEVNRRLCEEYGYQGIYIVFDEFSKYLEGHTQIGSGADMKVLQDMCELANSGQKESLFITFVAHKSLREYSVRMNKELQDQFRGIEGRMKEFLFVASARNNFDLIGSVLQKTDIFEQEWQTFFDDRRVSDFLGKTYELPIFNTQFSWEEYVKIVVKGCFPLTPMAAVLLLNICEKIAQNERTIFTFLANDEQNSLYHIIYGRQTVQGTYLSTALIYDYFSTALRETSDLPEVHNEWLKAEYALRQTKDSEARAIIKVIAILSIAGNRQEMPVNTRTIAMAAGITEEEVQSCVESLVEKELLIWRSKLGCYAFKNNVGVSLDEELQVVMQKFPTKFDIAEKLEEIADLEYVLPKSYNQIFSITRYFQYVYMTPQVLLQMATTTYLFEEKFSDGKMIALVSVDKINRDEILEQSRRWKDNRVLILLPDNAFRQEKNIRKLLGVKELLKDAIFLEDNKVLEQELKLYAEDLLFEINAGLEADYLPQNRGCEVIWNGEGRRFSTEKEFNGFLSEICGEYYNFSPKVNHELLNIQNVTGQYLKARNHVVEQILCEESMDAYEKGTSPEAMVYRTSLLRTGVRGTKFSLDVGTDHILKEIHQFILSSSDEKKCFGSLYAKLQGKEYGVRRGIMPIFLAVELTAVAGMPVLYLQSKEVEWSAEILNNINEKPESYYLYLEEDDTDKEAYLLKLENFLQIRKDGTGKRERISRLAEEMQRKYRALPRVVSTWNDYDEFEWKKAIAYLSRDVQPQNWVEDDAQKLYLASEKYMNNLRRMELNPRELLFEKLPRFFDRQQGDIMCAQAVEIIFFVWTHRLSKIREKLAEECLAIWNSKKGESLAVYLKEWYEKNRVGAENLVLSTRANGLKNCLVQLEGYNNEETVSKLAYMISDIHIEDWSKETKKIFLETLIGAKEEIENNAEQAGEQQNAKKVSFTDTQGNLVERYFQPDESGIGDFLKNAISEALEEFGDSMETGQKVAVLVEALEELLK